MKNWTSDVPAGSVIRLLNVPVALLDNDLPEGVTVQVVEQPKHAETADSLQAERVRLLERVAEIDRQLVAIVS
jgi:hypothetical protein